MSKFTFNFKTLETVAKAAQSASRFTAQQDAMIAKAASDAAAKAVKKAAEPASMNKIGLTSADCVIRDDAVNRHGREDTNVRRKIDPAVIEAAAQFSGRKSGPISRAEIEACTQKNARGSESIVGVMRAQRLKLQGKL